MDASESVAVFHHRIDSNLGDEPIEFLFEAVMTFFADCPADGLVDEDGDALLFQYGTDDWGSGPHFQVDLTRQFIEIKRDDDDHVVSHFHLTCFYKPTDVLTSIGSDDRWCWNKADLPAFTELVMGHPVLATVGPLPRMKTEIWWERV